MLPKEMPPAPSVAAYPQLHPSCRKVLACSPLAENARPLMSSSYQSCFSPMIVTLGSMRAITGVATMTDSMPWRTTINSSQLRSTPYKIHFMGAAYSRHGLRFDIACKSPATIVNGQPQPWPSPLVVNTITPGLVVMSTSRPNRARICMPSSDPFNSQSVQSPTPCRCSGALHSLSCRKISSKLAWLSTPTPCLSGFMNQHPAPPLVPPLSACAGHAR